MSASVTVGVEDFRLRALYANPYIARRIETDTRAAAPVSHPLATYLSAWFGDVFCGAFLAIRFSALEIEMHALLLRSALRNSRELGQAAVDWAFAQSGVERVTGYIIEGLTTALNYALKIGFRVEGFRRNICRKNGALLGVHVVGIIRSEWERTK
jgi:hypothetical protein